MTDQRSGARSYFAHADCGATWSLDGDVAEALCPNCDVLVVRRPRRPDAPAAIARRWTRCLICGRFRRCFDCGGDWFCRRCG